MSEKMYRLVYHDRPKDAKPPYEFDFVEIENYTPPTYDDLLSLVSKMYVLATTCQLYTRTLPIHEDVRKAFDTYIAEVENLGVTSEAIRWHQKPDKQIIPETEYLKRKKWKDEDDSKKSK